MLESRVTVKRAFRGAAILVVFPVLCFGVLALVWGSVVAGLIAIAYSFGMTVLLSWLSPRIDKVVAGQREPSPELEDYTRLEVLGHAGMVGPYAAALVLTWVTGDWFWIAMAVLWLLTGAVLLIRDVQRGVSISRKRIVNAFL